MSITSRVRYAFRSKRRQLRDSYSLVSFAQCGEDLIAEYVFRLRGIERPTYIDIGANHPFALSNTARFYERGCRGVNIDPNPSAMELFNEYRKEDVNLNVGISDTSGESDFFFMEDNTLSTFSPIERDHLVRHGKRQLGTARIKLMTLRTVIEQYCNGRFPDFLSLDVEGMELSVLRSIDFERNFPKLICVEIAQYSPIGAGERRTELADFLISKNYYEYASTNLNSIMVRNEFWFAPGRETSDR